jgi:hypothetical protein
MAKRFHFECDFEDLGPDRLSYEAEGPPQETASAAVEDGVAVLYVNKGACRLLAEVFAKLALGTHAKGFHVHLRQNFDFEGPEMLRITLTSPNDPD